ncbi:response regulator [Anaerotalea alkaliphila]|uniref:Stage 0 sporulation protein A homolog n=1 Tax=Anaerotalea alkaliphila TaxID=2662126 RepID=A0A7X5KNI2_9FIRM|nr:response regulator [Anaerotalea alkaliphila]NDL68054.1 response regulator [Anaerotalea alkaliphila]
MHRMIVADDEPKIRRGLISLHWDEIGVEIVAEASNGKEALELAIEQQPDLMLVDINMPILNGLDLIREIKSLLPECMLVIVSGYDEFSYAKEAFKLNVFDYILKPVNRNELMNTVKRAVDVLDEKRREGTIVQWAEAQVGSGRSELKRQFVSHWLLGRLHQTKMEEEYRVFSMDQYGGGYLLLLRFLEFEKKDAPAFDTGLLSFAVENIAEEIAKSVAECVLVFPLEQGEYGLLLSATDPSVVDTLGQDLKSALRQYLGRHCVVVHQQLGGDAQDLRRAYISLSDVLKQDLELTPLVLFAKSYLEEHYSNHSLSLQEVADQIKVSPAYLSRMIKKETGLTFSDLLTKARIDESLRLMKNPAMRILEISDAAGYSSQHYFSAAFKKLMGVSPNTYRTNRMGDGTWQR